MNTPSRCSVPSSVMITGEILSDMASKVGTDKRIISMLQVIDALLLILDSAL